MNSFFLKEIPELARDWDEIKSLFIEQEIPPNTTLLYEGDVANEIYFIETGALRLWNNDNGKDITFQFFFENQMVSSFESFYLEKPSNFSIESIEPTSITKLSKDSLKSLQVKYPSINAFITQKICERFMDYTNFFLSRIKDSPEKRYEQLLLTNPNLINRVQQYYIASYLGITPVSLSRIKARIHNNSQN
ncbi:cyclic nucleotide-binding domain-containing protein [Erwinia sp. CPCC 100877]|nr:cyclic nucleotide-binding domain-containing protein [Erwinia sp. CPCC 100877]